jgi:pimeloyl-ACP methyl ester carboxylesterase
MILQVLKWLAYLIVGVLSLILISLQAYKLSIRYATRIKAPNGISSLEAIELGGVKQWIFIRGENTNNPVLIFLHGGPGEPILGMSSSRNLDAELIKHFTVVHWDQRGAGKSYYGDIPVQSMSLDSLVEDCHALIDIIRARFNTQKVFLVGHSDGTQIGLLAAHRYPEKIHAYVGVAQVINDYEQHRISYDFVVEEAEKSGDVTVQNAIEAIGPPPYDSPQQMFAKARYIGQYGGFIHENPIKKMGLLWLGYLTSPEYSFVEAVNTMRGKGLNFTVDARWEEIIRVDFTEEIQSIDIPIYFVMGKYDMITPLFLVEEFYENLNAENGKQLFILENSAHFPPTEDKEIYENILINVVLRNSQENDGAK